MNLNVGEGDQRRELLHQVGMNLPELTSTSDWITRTFSDSEQLSTNEFHALVVIAMANAGSAAMTPSTLRTQIGLSGAAITYVVQRLCESGYVRRGSDPRDRRKVVLRLTERGDRVVKELLRGHRRAHAPDLGGPARRRVGTRPPHVPGDDHVDEGLPHRCDGGQLISTRQREPSAKP